MPRNREASWAPHSLHTKLLWKLVNGTHFKMVWIFVVSYVLLNAFSTKNRRDPRSETTRVAFSGECSSLGDEGGMIPPSHRRQPKRALACIRRPSQMVLVARVGPGSGQWGFYRSSLSCTSSQELCGVSHWSYSPGSRNEGGRSFWAFFTSVPRMQQRLTIPNHAPGLPLCPNCRTSMSDKAHELNVHCCTNLNGSQAGCKCEEGEGGARGRPTYVCIPGVSGQAWSAEASKETSHPSAPAGPHGGKHSNV